MSISTRERQLGFVRDLRRSLLQLEDDIALANEGYEIAVSVDFSAIFSFLHRPLNRGFVAGLPDEEPARVRAREILALELAFSKSFPRMLLIEPYIEELHNYLAVTKRHLIRAAEPLAFEYRRALRRLVEASEAYQQYVTLTAAGSAAGQASALEEVAAKIGRQFFPELFAVMATERPKPIEVLRELLASGRLVDANALIPEMVSESDLRASVSKRAAFWARRIAAIRKENRSYQSYIDGWALAFLEHANGISRKREVAVVLLTPSPAVVSAVERADAGDDRASNGLVPRCLLRDLNYVLVRTTHGNDRVRVQDTLRSVDDLLRMHVSDGGTDDEWERRLRALLDVVQPTWLEAQNEYLMTDPMWISEGASLDRVNAGRILSLLEMLCTGDEERERRLEHEASQRLANLWSVLDEVERGLPVPGGWKAFSRVQVQHDRRGAWVRLHGLADELPSALFFRSRRVAQLAEGLGAECAQQAPQETARVREAVIRRGAEPEAEAEERLIAAYQLALERKYSSSIRMLTRGVAEATSEHLEELFYLLAVLHRMLFEGSRAETYIKTAVDIRPNDLRFRLEAVKIQWVRTVEAERVTLSDREVAGVDRALQALAEAERVRGSSDLAVELEPQLANATAFLCAERFVRSGEAVFLSRALEGLQRLEGALPEDQWTSRFRDTKAWVQFASALGDVTLARAERALIVREVEAAVLEVLGVESRLGVEVSGARRGVLERQLARIREALAERSSGDEAAVITA